MTNPAYLLIALIRETCRSGPLFDLTTSHVLEIYDFNSDDKFCLYIFEVNELFNVRTAQSRVNVTKLRLCAMYVCNIHTRASLAYCATCISVVIFVVYVR